MFSLAPALMKPECQSLPRACGREEAQPWHNNHIVLNLFLICQFVKAFLIMFPGKPG